MVQSVVDYETVEEEWSFMRATIAGISDPEAGRQVPLTEVKAKFGLG